MADVKKIAEELVSLTVKDVQELAKILKDEYGIEPAAAPVVVAGPAAESAVAEQSAFDVVLISPGQAKLQMVKVVKEITGLGLKEAKELVDAAPKAIKEKVSKAEAEQLKAQLEEAGGEVELK
ncbi:MAG: 50S ribosomal protein L7/L12 [Bacteroidales bacterium]|nr:50S ribosomal protein L7/L12 [Bacteroidales bacterium]MCL2133581.1 50S ribosomal protein L7/L12 [Bacteroidales bacterium]